MASDKDKFQDDTVTLAVHVRQGLTIKIQCSAMNHVLEECQHLVKNWK